DDAELFDGVGIGGDVAGIAETGHVVAAVEVVVDGAGAAIDASINGGALFGETEDDAVAAGGDARGKGEEGVDVAADDGEGGDFGGVDRASDLGVIGVDGGGGGDDLDGVGDLTDVERGVDAGGNVDLERDAFLDELLEAGSGDLDGVGA